MLSSTWYLCLSILLVVYGEEIIFDGQSTNLYLKENLHLIKYMVPKSPIQWTFLLSEATVLMGCFQNYADDQHVFWHISMDYPSPRKSQNEEALYFRRPNIIRIVKPRTKDLRVQGIKCLLELILEITNKANCIYVLSHILDHILSR